MGKRSVIALGAFGAGATLMSVSTSSADVVLNLGSHMLFGNQWVTFGVDLTGGITGFTIEFDYVTNGIGSWASDLAFVIDSPRNQAQQWGGFDLLWPGANAAGPWSFDGVGSAGSGFYTDTKCVELSGNGTWLLRVGNGWSIPSQFVFYNNIVVTLKDGRCPGGGIVGDIDGDGLVDGADLGALLASWGACAMCAADIDGNGIVDGADLGALLANWS